MSQLHPNNEQSSDKSRMEAVLDVVVATNHDVIIGEITDEHKIINSPEKTITPTFEPQQELTLVSLPPQNINSNNNNITINNNIGTLNSQQQETMVALNLEGKSSSTNPIPNNNNQQQQQNVACSPPITTNDHPLQPTVASATNTTTAQPQQPQQQGATTVDPQQQQQIATVDQKQENEGKKKKKKRKEDYDSDDTENDLLDNDLVFSADELELLKSEELPPISFDLLSEIQPIPAHLRTRLTILQQQQIIYSLHSLNLSDKQRKELMLLGNVMKRITQDELMKCSIFESVNVYLFILCVSTLAAAVGTLALALIYFVVLKEAVAEGTFSIVLSAIFTITLVGCILLCIVFNIKNRPKHKFRKSTLAHYHEVFEEAIYDIGVKFFPNFEIEFDYHNIIDNHEVEELESKRRKLRQNYRYYEYFRSKRLLSKYTAEQLLCYLHITSAENFEGIKTLFKLTTKDENEHVNMENPQHKEEGAANTTGINLEQGQQQQAAHQQDLNQNIVQIKKIPSYFSSFSTSNNSGIYIPAAVIEQTSTPGDNIWYSLCCAFGGLCTLIIVLIFLLFSAICLFFPLIYSRSPKIPIFNTFPIEVGYGMVGVLGLTFLVLLCFSSCSVYCCLFVKHTNRSADGEENDGEEQNRPMCCCYFELDNNDDDGFLAPVGDLI